FPITGPLVAQGRYLTTDDLDECHGITSEIIQDEQKKTTYHYVMTQDFPYSVSCFRGKPVRLGPSDHSQNNGPRVIEKNAPPASQPIPQQPFPPQPPLQGPLGGSQTKPPQAPGEAVAACEDK